MKALLIGIFLGWVGIGFGGPLQNMHAIVAKKRTGGGGGGTPTWVQDDGADFDPFGTSRSVTFGSTTVSGNCIVAIYDGSNASSLTCTASGATFTTHVDGSSSGIAIAVAPNITGSASHQVTFAVTNNPNPGRIIIIEFENIATSSPVDDSDQEFAFQSNSSIDVTTSVNNTMLIGAVTSSTGGATAGSGFTLRHAQATKLQTESGIGATSGTNAIGFSHSERSAGLSVIALKPE